MLTSNNSPHATPLLIRFLRVSIAILLVLAPNCSNSGSCGRDLMEFRRHGTAAIARPSQRRLLP